MNVLVVTLALFCLGLYGVLTRREVIGILACVELMLGAATVLLIALAVARVPTDPALAGIALAVLVLAAAEAAVGLAILVTMVKRSGRGRVDEMLEMEG